MGVEQKQHKKTSENGTARVQYTINNCRNEMKMEQLEYLQPMALS